MTIEELFNWVRGNQDNGKLTQSQVNGINALLVTMTPTVVQDSLSKINGWIIRSKSGMLLSKNGADMMKRYEGFVGKPYRDMVGVWTIGYGNTYYPDRRKVKSTDRHITEPEGAKLKQDIINLDFAPAVNKIFADEIAAGKLNQNQFDALVSLVYNIGIAALARSGSVTENIKAGRYKSAADGFLKFNNGTVNGKFGPISGLTRRRTEERALFLS